MTRKLLVASLICGAILDFGLAVVILYAPYLFSQLTGVALPQEMVYLRLTGILLVTLAMVYVVAAATLERAPHLVSVAAAGRLLGFVFCLRVWMEGYPVQFLVLGMANLVLATTHGFLLYSYQQSSSSRLEDA